MENFVEISIETGDSNLKEILIAELSEVGFDGFEETEIGLKAFIKEAEFNEDFIKQTFNRYNLQWSKTLVPKQNWNALWESNFEPVVVDDFCEVRADFHTPSESTEHEIIITPKMSFGTGHHATTYMMISQMKDLNFKQKTVADFGTGTGILAILAEKLGSSKVVAIDYDDWSIENAEENLERNNSRVVELQKGDAFSPAEPFDIILANINKNVILENVDGLVFGLNQGGFLLISGILKQDEEDMIQAFQMLNLSHFKTVERSNWISILFGSVEKRIVN